MRTRILGAILALAAVSAACGEGVGAEVRDTIGALDRIRSAPHTYTYTDESLNSDQTIVIEGRVRDDFRYGGTVSLNGRPLYEQIISDDAVALRLLEPESLAEVVELARRTDAITGNALAEGRWVVDFTAAPEIALRASGSDSVPGDEPFVGSAKVPSYAQGAMRDAIGAGRFNREAIDYNPLDDPWSSDAEVDLEGEGIRRMDLVPPPLPSRAERGQTQSLPEIAHFRKMAVYVRGERAIEIREQISIDDRQEFRRAEDDRAADYFLRLRDSAKLGAVDGALREREMTYSIEFTDVEVTIPEEAETGLLTVVLDGLNEIFDFEVIGGAGPAIPDLPQPGTPEEPEGPAEAPAPPADG